MGAPQAPIVSYAAVQCIQSSPRPATVQRAPEARDWATSLRRGVAPAPTVFMVMACLATQCLLCRSCTWGWNVGYSAMSCSGAHRVDGHGMSGHTMCVHTMSVGKS